MSGIGYTSRNYRDPDPEADIFLAISRALD